MEAPDKSLGMLVSKVDFIARIDNNYAVPRLAAFETVDASGSWNALKSKFAYTQVSSSSKSTHIPPVFSSLDDSDWIATSSLTATKGVCGITISDHSKSAAL